MDEEFEWIEDPYVKGGGYYDEFDLSDTGLGAPGTGDTLTRNDDGSITTVHTNADGTETSSTSAAPALSVDKVFNWLKTPAGAAIGIAGLDKILGGNLANMFGFGTKGNAGAAGFRGAPANLTATQTQIAQPAYTPYSGQATMGRKQFTDMVYSPTVAPVAGAEPVTPAPFVGGYAPGAPAAAIAPVPVARTVIEPEAETPEQRAAAFANFKANTTPSGDIRTVAAAEGGLMGLARGGSTGQPRYLQGATDGMADKLNTDIDGRQAAKLSHGEFVVPADVVSHLGNGNSDAGAQVLYKMMDRVRKARTGNSKQGKQINPAKFMPGGLATLPAYAGGGAVAFDAGGIAPPPVTKESNLSEWAGPTVAGMVAKSSALANAPYQAYTGPLTAGSSPLQQAAGINAGNINVPTGAMGSFTPGTFNTATAQQYMNPYIQSALDPQIAEARRQSQITQMGNAAQATRAGAFGGSRGALMNTETQRNLGTNLANITGQGYNTAYNNAQQQFNTEQGRQQTAQDATNRFGLDAITKQADLGATQQATEQAGISALKGQFEEERQDPYNKLLFQQKMLTGLPISTQTTSTAQTPAQAFSGTASELKTLIEKMLG
jgi:hypothetical protein